MLGIIIDFVYKVMEILLFGFVVLIDIVGIDDEGVFGKFRVEKILEVLDKIDIVILVVLDFDDLIYEKWFVKFFE